MVKPTLESLPTELLILILLEIPDRASLKSIVISSPQCHRAYLGARRQLLLGLIQRQNKDGLLDLSEAIAAVRAKGLWLAHKKEEAIALLDTWRRRKEISELGLTHAKSLDQPADLDETVSLLHLLEKLYFFLEDFPTSATQPSWINSTEWGTKLPIRLSKVEKRRFLRALCRLQLHANIFGTPEKSIDLGYPCDHNQWLGPPEDESHEEAYRLLYGVIPIWEYEEMGCVWKYLMGKFESITREISHDLCQLAGGNPHILFSQILPEDERPEGGVINCLDDSDIFPDYLNAFTSIGPDFLYRALHTSRQRRRKMMTKNMDISAISFIGWYTGVYLEEWRPFHEPADPYGIQNFEAFWSTLPQIEQPNLGWRKIWLLPHTSEDSLLEALNPNRNPEIDWIWGYALWDGKRLKEWKAPILEGARPGYQAVPAPLLLLPAPYYETYHEPS
ncbi:uncharacterized protein N7459_001440 [Penicillium hispanicum]|uniref:uncharacterized protein n=1 Tax=Penicillium hispanicum TaxID=1080232 RepID=UPI002540AC11|nr:uncharacterized protein N7459_001440 [Penicillium hispanicum]KAJ5595232.1 hypothetical protein N7459_001440 [Penicillium hispanicum]